MIPLATLLLAVFALIESWWIGKALKRNRSKFFDGQSTALGHFELVKSLENRLLLDFDDIDHFSNSSTEIVHPSCQYKSSAADTCWPTPGSHPVAIHALNDANCVIGNSHCFSTELKALRESKDQIFRVDGLNDMSVRIHAKLLNQIFVDMTKIEDIEL